MKLLAVILLLLLPMLAQANRYDSIALYTPKPPYPDKYWGANKAGRVKASYFIQSDGTVNKIEILESTHPGYSHVVEHTLKKWRFKPWVVKEGRPSEVKEFTTLVFTYNPPEKEERKINAELNEWLCSDVNENIKSSKVLFPGEPVSKMVFYWSTRSRISEVFIYARLSDAERSGLLDKLDAAIPEIVQKCSENPEVMYQDYLPEEIKRLL